MQSGIQIPTFSDGQNKRLLHELLTRSHRHFTDLYMLNSYAEDLLRKYKGITEK